MRVAFFLAVLLLPNVASAGKVTITNTVVGVPVRVDYEDTGVNGVTHTFFLEPRESRSVIVNRDIRLTVFERGSGRRQTSGSFPGVGRVLIERTGTRWRLSHLR
jgi:hypothetical protein